MSAFTDILLSLLLFSSGTIIPQCCLRGSCLKRYTPDIISCMNVSKDIQCSSISERHRYKVLSDSESKGNMNPFFCKFSISPLPPNVRASTIFYNISEHKRVWGSLLAAKKKVNETKFAE